MRKMASFLAAILMIVVAGCGGTSSNTEPEARPMEEDPNARGRIETAVIKDYTDLDKYSGQMIYVTGTFHVHPKHRGKHGYVKLRTGLIIYLPHIDQHYRGDDWYRFENQMVYVGGKLHSYVDHEIDGMPGPYMDEPTRLEAADRAGAMSVPKKPVNDPNRR